MSQPAVFCRKCGSPLSQDARFCNYCGADVLAQTSQPAPAVNTPAPGSVCLHCGAPLPAGARFCTACGQSADALPPVAEPVAPPVTEPVVEPITPPVAEPVMEPVAPPVVEPVAPPVMEPVAPPVVGPVVEPITPPVAEPVVEPVAPPVAEPIAPPVAEPVVEPVAPPVAEPVVEPVAPQNYTAPVEAPGSVCIHCGAPLPAGARFCTTCGQPVQAPPVTEPAAPQGYAAPVETYAAPVETPAAPQGYYAAPNYQGSYPPNYAPNQPYYPPNQPYYAPAQPVMAKPPKKPAKPANIKSPCTMSILAWLCVALAAGMLAVFEIFRVSNSMDYGMKLSQLLTSPERIIAISALALYVLTMITGPLLWRHGKKRRFIPLTLLTLATALFCYTLWEYIAPMFFVIALLVGVFTAYTLLILFAFRVIRTRVLVLSLLPIPVVLPVLTLLVLNPLFGLGNLPLVLALLYAPILPAILLLLAFTTKDPAQPVLPVPTETVPEPAADQAEPDAPADAQPTGKLEDAFADPAGDGAAFTAKDEFTDPPAPKVKKPGRVKRFFAHLFTYLACLAILLVCSGWAMYENWVYVDDVINQPVSRVEQGEYQRLFVQTTPVYHDTIPAGHVVSQSLASGTLVRPWSEIELEVSKGPGVKIPDLTGMPVSQAETLLKDLGLRVTKTSEYSSRYPANQVIRISSNHVDEGATVELTVSLGPDLRVQVPNVSSFSQSSATDRLRNLGFNVNVVYMYTSCSMRDTPKVLSYFPTGKQDKGTTITLTVVRPSLDITSASYSFPSYSGLDFILRFKNTSDRTIQRVVFNVTLRDSSGVNLSSAQDLTYTGTLAPGASTSRTWSDLTYNRYTHQVCLNSIRVTFTDGSTQTLSGNHVWYWN